MYSKHLVNVKYIKENLKIKGLCFKKCHSNALYELDQDHFLGLEATKKCVEDLVFKFKPEDTVLDIGSGFGGVGRYIAEKTGAHVTGIEMQKDRCDFAVRATKNLGLNHKVSFVNDDFVTTDLRNGSFSKVIAFLSILHIIDKKATINKVSNVLKTDGMIYFEDFYKMKTTFSKEENLKLRNIISCPNLLTRDEYFNELKMNNIEIQSVDDLTENWKHCAASRFDEYNENFELLRTQVGKVKSFKALEFAKGVLDLFDSGIIYGFRIIGKKTGYAVG